jgi:creatinine amidohydrolase
MHLQRMTWPEVGKIPRETLVLIPTGSLEQHGPHLPLFTDSLLVTYVAEAVEKQLAEKVLLTPTLWLGASGHHLKFPGTLSASFETYEGAVQNVVESLMPHGFHRFYVLNGHGGNTDANSIALRKLKEKNRNCTFGHSGYFAFADETIARTLTGPTKHIRHACEAEASMMLHAFPDLVRVEKLRDDGLKPDPAIRGLVHMFDEVTEEGSLGFATEATAEKGRILLEAAISAIVRELGSLADGYMLIGE